MDLSVAPRASVVAGITSTHTCVLFHSQQRVRTALAHIIPKLCLGTLLDQRIEKDPANN